MKNMTHWALVPKRVVLGALFVLGTLTVVRPGFGGGGKPSAEPPSADWLVVMERLHRTIKPDKDEWRFASLPWVSTVAEARQLAAAQGKPMFIWYMVGEPLGQC